MFIGAPGRWSPEEEASEETASALTGSSLSAPAFLWRVHCSAHPVTRTSDCQREAQITCRGHPTAPLQRFFFFFRPLLHRAEERPLAWLRAVKENAVPRGGTTVSARCKCITLTQTLRRYTLNAGQCPRNALQGTQRNALNKARFNIERFCCLNEL